jgi:hypothetical protein
MKKLEELEAACMESRQANLFFIDPQDELPAGSLRESGS